MLKGLAASSGIGVGRAFVFKPDRISIVKASTANHGAEQQKFLNAVGTFCAESLKTYYHARDHIGEKEAAIITAQIVIITDPDLHKKVIGYIRKERYTAEYAFSLVCDQYIHVFNEMEDELMRARAADFQDIKNRMLQILLNLPRQSLHQLPNGCVLVAEDIAPSHAVTLNPHRVKAIVTQQGGVQSHVAIIARSLQIPIVVGVSSLLSSVRENDRLLVDGDNGHVVKDPSPKQCQSHGYAEPEYVERPSRGWPIVINATNTQTIS